MRFIHIINPVKVKEDNKSYLYYTQPITFESMIQAKKKAYEKDIQVELYAVCYPEDASIIPAEFTILPFLNRSILDKYSDITNRKLPYLQDIFDSVKKKNNKADFYIYTNSDIVVHSSFYVNIYRKIKKMKIKAFIINRRDNIPQFFNNIRLGKEHLSLICEFEGEKHPGRDCFIICREFFIKLDMKNMFLACPPWGLVLMKYLAALSSNFKVLREEYLTFHLGKDNNHSNGQKTELTELNYANSKEIQFI